MTHRITYERKDRQGYSGPMEVYYAMCKRKSFARIHRVGEAGPYYVRYTDVVNPTTPRTAHNVDTPFYTLRAAKRMCRELAWGMGLIELPGSPSDTAPRCSRCSSAVVAGECEGCGDVR